MQSLGINKQTVYYSLYLGITDIIDDDGNMTGEKQKTYSDPVSCRMNVSASRGTAENEPFGVTSDYTKTMSTSDMDCPIDEESILWVGIGTSEAYNYKVTKVAKSLNSILYAIKEVRNA